jgi:hypothetical protein
VHLLILAQEATPKGLWYPTILGVLVVIAAVGLFCGSIYLLLATNFGARLGFLIAFTGLAGFVMLLSLLWWTSATPLNVPKGRVAQWRVVEEVTSLSKSKIPQAREIRTNGHKATANDASNTKATADAALITKVSTPTAPVTPAENKYAQFGDVTQYEIVHTYTIGGSKPQFWKFQLHHTPKFAVAEYCGVVQAPPNRPFGLPPLKPTCATGADAKTGFLVMEYDLGSLRVPPFVIFVTTATLFGLGLLCLHWREKDEMLAAAAAQQAQPQPVPVPAKV